MDHFSGYICVRHCCQETSKPSRHVDSFLQSFYTTGNLRIIIRNNNTGHRIARLFQVTVRNTNVTECMFEFIMKLVVTHLILKRKTSWLEILSLHFSNILFFSCKLPLSSCYPMDSILFMNSSMNRTNYFHQKLVWCKVVNFILYWSTSFFFLLFRKNEKKILLNHIETDYQTFDFTPNLIALLKESASAIIDSTSGLKSNSN